MAWTLERERQSFQFFRCASCAHVYVHNCRVDTATPAGSERPPARPRHYQVERLLRQLLAGNERPMVVEIGCAYGEIGSLVSPWAQFVGFEPSDGLADFALARGLDIRTELFSVASLQYPADAVILDNVLEHVLAPAELVEQAADALRPGGFIVVIAPNINDIRAMIPAWRNRHLWVPPEHINYFSRKDIRRLLEERGFSLAPFGFRALKGSADAKYSLVRWRPTMPRVRSVRIVPGPTAFTRTPFVANDIAKILMS